MTTNESRPALNEEQTLAVTAIEAWLKAPNGELFYLLSGSAGTGKTFCVQQLLKRVRGRLIFTAPTNKATKVLRESVSRDGYQPECKTIYSLLGLRLEANGEIRELTAPEEPIDLSQYACVIVDEASMVNAHLFSFIKQTAEEYNLPFLFMGDPAQLPPVGEKSSHVWNVTNRSHLDRVMRYDNQILTLATALRKVVDRPAPSVRMDSDNDGVQGVWRLAPRAFEAAILKCAEQGHFQEVNRAKAVAWRNTRVDALNKMIRDKIFDRPTVPWLESDRVIFTAPAKNFDDETIATTDDEGTVEKVTEGYHPREGEFKCHFLTIQLDDNRVVSAWALHPDSQMLFMRRTEELAQAAREDRRKWKKFWEFKEQFHNLRHAYAITAHRAQGSTYETTFVDMNDVLLNRNRQEAFRCLYVACTRPKRVLVLG